MTSRFGLFLSAKSRASGVMIPRSTISWRGWEIVRTQRGGWVASKSNRYILSLPPGVGSIIQVILQHEIGYPGAGFIDRKEGGS